jgi:hypothetical protein
LAHQFKSCKFRNAFYASSLSYAPCWETTEQNPPNKNFAPCGRPRSRVTTPRDQPGFSDKARDPSIAPRRAILRRDTGQTYREMMTWMAKECGIDTRQTDNLVRPDRVRKGKKRCGED